VSVQSSTFEDVFAPASPPRHLPLEAQQEFARTQEAGRSSEHYFYLDFGHIANGLNDSGKAQLVGVSWRDPAAGLLPIWRPMPG
jgi:hypothetical protein